MYLRSESYEEMEEDICELFDIVPEYLKERLQEFDNKCPPTNDDLLNELLDDFIDSECNLDLLNGLRFFHLSVCDGKIEELRPLDELLTQNSTIKDILEDNGIAFEKKDEKLVLIKDGKSISEEWIKNRNSLLARRMGLFNEADFCINGFSFWTNIEETSDDYFEALEAGPEFLYCLDDLLKTQVSAQYRARNHYYGVVCEVSFDNVIFDDYQQIDVDCKKRLLVRNAMKMLLGYYLGSVYHGCNLLLRIPDDEHIVVDKVIHICD